MSDKRPIWGVTVGTPQNPKKITHGYVPTSRKVAGIDLLDDITKSELLTALGLIIDQNYSATSKNAQSGKAVKEAVEAAKTSLTGVINAAVVSLTQDIEQKADKWEVENFAVEHNYNPESTHAQSGQAVAEAMSTLVRHNLTHYMPVSVDSMHDYGLENLAFYIFIPTIGLGVTTTLSEIKTAIIGDIENTLNGLEDFLKSI